MVVISEILLNVPQFVFSNKYWRLESIIKFWPISEHERLISWCLQRTLWHLEQIFHLPRRHVILYLCSYFEYHDVVHVLLLHTYEDNTSPSLGLYLSYLSLLSYLPHPTVSICIKSHPCSCIYVLIIYCLVENIIPVFRVNSMTLLILWLTNFLSHNSHVEITSVLTNLKANRLQLYKSILIKITYFNAVCSKKQLYNVLPFCVWVGSVLHRIYQPSV